MLKLFQHITHKEDTMKIAVIKMIAKLYLKDLYALNSLEGEAFREGLREYKQKNSIK